jgi:hypothetical protein
MPPPGGRIGAGSVLLWFRKPVSGKEVTHMSKVASDLDSLIGFRDHLIRFNRTLGEEFAGMRGHWQGLGDAWTDAKYYEFGQALEEVARGIDRYLAATEGHEGHLLRLIEIMRSYLDTHV